MGEGGGDMGRGGRLIGGGWGGGGWVTPQSPHNHRG